MTDRLRAAFAALEERGTIAGADAAWQRAVLAAAVDDRPALAAEAGPPLVPVLRRDDGPGWIEVRAASAGRRGGRRRVGLAVGLVAAGVVGIGVTLAALDGGDGGRTIPGGPSDATSAAPPTIFATTAPDAGQTDTTPAIEFAPETSFAELPGDTIAAGSATTFGGFGGVVDPTRGGYGALPCVAADDAAGVDTADAPVSTAPTASDATATTSVMTATTSAGGPYGPVEVCAYPSGALPEVTEGPGSDWVASATTLPGDAQLVYWRMLDDLDITWRAEADSTLIYWRTPAGQGSVVDDLGGPLVLVVPTEGGYIALARAGTTDSGSVGQRPIAVQFTLADGRTVSAPVTYANEFGLGYATIATDQPVVAARGR